LESDNAAFREFQPCWRSMADEVLTIKESAALLKLPEKTLYAMAHPGEIPAFKVCQGITRTELERWIDAQPRAGERRGGNAAASYATWANTAAPNLIVVRRVATQCGNVHVARGTACAMDNALLLRDIRAPDVAKLDTVRPAIECTIALLKQRRAAFTASSVTRQLEVMESAA